jgi:site-specific DNA-methyltransferase (adenine-specific)
MLLVGDCVEQMKTLEENSVDAIVTDPPYGLEFMGKAWDGFGTPLGFQTWSEQWAREALRVLKPGGHLLAFGGTRMYHRLAAGIEDAGFEIRDTLMWLYGSGFPKSHNLKGEWQGWGTALKPAVEPIVLARKPLIGTVAENVLTHGTGALNIDASRIGTEQAFVNRIGNKSSGGILNQTGEQHITSGGAGRWPANILLDEEAAALLDEQSGVSKSPAPYIRSVDASRAEWLALPKPNGSLNDSYGDSGGASRFFYVAKASRAERNAGLDGFAAIRRATSYGSMRHPQCNVCGTRAINWEKRKGMPSCGHDDFSYVEQTADGKHPGNPERNIHPTVKPVDLMRYLITLVTPKGGTVLDPFMGSGTTAVAAIGEGVNWIGCEREPEYVAIIEARIAAAQPGMGLNLEEDIK